MDDKFLTACFAGQVVVCGRRLTVFSTWHYTILTASLSPMVMQGRDVQPEHIVAAVRVCAQRHGKFPNLKPTLRDFYWKWRLERDADLFHREFQKFDAWMADHASAPRFWDIDEGGPRMRELTGPRALIPVTTAMLKLGLSESAAWDMSMGKLQWYCAQAAELEGAERKFLDETDLAASAKALDEAEAKLPPPEIFIPMMMAAGDITEQEARRQYEEMKAGKESRHGA